MDPRRHTPSDRVPVNGRVAVFRALPGLGDLLCAVPALRAIRLARPDVEISLIGLPGTAPLAGRFGRYIDRFFPFPGFPGLPDIRPDIRQLPGFLAAMQGWEFDLAIQLHGSGDLTNSVVALLGAREMAGHYPASGPPVDAAGFLPWTETYSEIRRGLRLMSHLGWPSDDVALEFLVDAIGEAEVLALDGRDVLERPYVVVHPGAASPRRRWSAVAFAGVADELAREGHGIVLTGTAAEQPVTAAVASRMRSPALDLAGRTRLDALAVILRRASLLVCNDTGVSHLAAALRVPSVVVFRDSSVERWAPLDRRLHRVTAGPPRDVLGQARSVLRETHSHAA